MATRTVYQRRSPAGEMLFEFANFEFLSAPAIVNDDVGNVFVYDPISDMPAICQVYPSVTACQSIDTSGATLHSPPFMYFGATTDPNATCAPTVGAPPVPCFDMLQPLDIAALGNRVLFVTFQGTVDGRQAVFFVRNVGGSLMNWTTPVRVSAPSATQDFVEPRIVALLDGTIVIGYVRARQNQLDPFFPYRFAVSTDGGSSFTEYEPGPTTIGFRPKDLPFHCRRNNFFLGEYHDGARRGGRGVLLYHQSLGGAAVLQNHIFSAASLY
jgi:hypothetical protein